MPIVTILKTRFHENAVLISWEVLPPNDLTNEENFRFEVCPRTQLVIHLLHLVDLFLLHIFESLLLNVLLVLAGRFFSVIQEFMCVPYSMLLVVLARIGVLTITLNGVVVHVFCLFPDCSIIG